MANPTDYTKDYDFSAYQATKPNEPLPGDRLDTELQNIETAIGETQTALSDIRRSDGKLQNDVVTVDAIDDEAFTAITLSTAENAAAAAESAEEAAASAASIKSITAEASTLAEGASATADYAPVTGVLTFGIPRGNTGPQGVQGPVGPTGTGINPQGSVSTSTSLPGYPSSYMGSYGDSYIAEDTGSLWVWAESDSWIDFGSIQGPQGAQGIQGPQGDAGAQGIQGPQGDTGPQGPEGPTGSYTNAEVKALYEGNANTNAFTDDEKTKLTGVDDGAKATAGLTFETVADMVASTKLTVGDVATTRGYFSAGDGGATVYKIVAASTGTVDGGSYINLTGITGQAEARLTTDLHAAQFGCPESTGGTDSKAAWDNLLDYIRSKVNLNGGDPFEYAPTYRIRGGLYALADTLSVDARSIRLHCDFMAADAWAGAATDPVLKLTAGAGYANFDGIVDCNRKSSGVWIIAGRCDLGETNIFHMATGAGVYGVKFGDGSGSGSGGGDIWLRGGHVTQWYPEDSEFSVEASWTADTVVIDRADCKLWGTTLRWAKRLVYLTAAANTFKASGCHFINGGASDRIRVNPILIESERIGNIVLTDNYLDNGKLIIRSKRFTSKGNQSIELSDRSDVDFKFTFYPHTDGAYPEVRIDDMHMFNIMDGSLATFIDEGAYSWPMPTADLEALIDADKDHLDISVPRVRARIPREAAAADDYTDILATTRASGNGAIQKLMDRDTTDVASAPYVRSAGDDLAIGASSGSVNIEDQFGEVTVGTEPLIVLGMGASNMRTSPQAAGGDRTIESGVLMWNSSSVGQSTPGAWTAGSQFNQAAFGTAPLDVLDTGGTLYANSLLLQTCNALRRRNPTRPVYGIMLASGGHGPVNFLTSATRTANSWSLPADTEDMTLNYSNIATAIAAVPGSKTVADVCLWYGTAGAEDGQFPWQTQFDLVWDQAIASGLVSQDKTRIVVSTTGAARSSWADVKKAISRVAASRPNMVTTDSMGAVFPDDIHLDGDSVTDYGKLMAGAAMGEASPKSRAIVLTSSEHNAPEAMTIIDDWNGDNSLWEKSSDEGSIGANLNVATQVFRITGTGAVDYMRVGATGMEVSANIVMGTTESWTFAATWRGIKITDRHGLQATPSNSSVALSSNCAVGASGWEYTADAKAGNFTQSGGAHIFNRAVAGVDGDPVTFIETARFEDDGVLKPGADNSQSLGAAAKRWSVVYAGTGTINTSDERSKEQIVDLDAAETRVAVAAKGLLKKFKFRDAAAGKGASARWHFGVIAQELVAAFEAEGLDAFDYGLLCWNEWWEADVQVPAVYVDKIAELFDEDGDMLAEPITEAVLAEPARVERQTFESAEAAPEGAERFDRYGVRYEELFAFILAAA